MSSSDHAPSELLRVEELMKAVRRKVREHHAVESTNGHSSTDVEALLREAIDVRDDVNDQASQNSRAIALALPRLLRDRDEDWRLKTYLRFSSHRRVIGPVIGFCKRHVLLPMFRWFHEYSRENFRRQNNLNVTMFACIELLASENIRLRREVNRLQQISETRSSP